MGVRASGARAGHSNRAGTNVKPEKQMKPLTAPQMTSRLPRLRKLLEFLNHAGPTVTVVLARLWILSQTAVRYFHVRPGCGGREFPAHDRFLVRVKMPVRDPRVDEKPRRIEFQDLAVTFELADTVNHEVAFLCGVAVLAAEARIHLPEFY